MSVSDYLEEVKTVSAVLDYNIRHDEERHQYQTHLYSELYRIFIKQANKLANLANSINEQVLSSASQEELAVQYYQVLSNALLRLADCSRRVSLRFKSEILDPTKTFHQNYQNLYQDMSRKIEAQVTSVVHKQHDTMRAKDAYMSACDKFEKHREMQKKVMERIENGNKNELQKFNQATKKLTEQISHSQKFYLAAVEQTNNGWNNLRKEFTSVTQSIAYNEDTRIAFFRKSVVNSIKTFEEFSTAHDPEITRKVEEMVNASKSKFEDVGQKKLRFLLNKITDNHHRLEFVSYEDVIKRKRKRLLSEDTSHLTQHFSAISEGEKRSIENLVEGWFEKPRKMNGQSQSPDKSTTQPHLRKDRSTRALSAGINLEDSGIRQVDDCKQRILSVSSHSMYFIQHMYEKVSELSSFYCKIGQDSFLFLLNAYVVIANNMDPNTDLGIEFLYKMMVAAQRIMLKKQKAHGQPIQLLCHKFGKHVARFKDPALLKRLLTYLEKRKFNKKKHSSESGKGTFNSLAKGFLATFSTRKNPTLTDEQIFSCIEELVHILANFSVPNEVVLPFIKDSLGQSYQGSYDYLKGIILTKKDQQERQSLFFRKEIHGKREELLRKAIDNKQTAQYAIKIVAQHGFLAKKDIQLRLVCKSLEGVHLEILGRLKMMPTEHKWIRLIPINNQLSYISMKQEVAEQSVPSAVEEIITLDVNRSLHLHGETLNPTILHSLLRTYAYFHRDVSYCQGMNYLVGYIYIKTLNQENTYRIFEYLMETRFKEIFVNEFEVLKLKMYQFERLLTVFHPDISDHFKRQSISPQCYIVSWIITLFASSYQYTLRSYLIDFLWERFIVWGWPQFFRFVIWIFSLFKEDLVELTYDKALHFLGELGKSEMFLADPQKFATLYSHIEDPASGLQRYPISQELLNKFTQQYSLDQ